MSHPNQQALPVAVSRWIDQSYWLSDDAAIARLNEKLAFVTEAIDVLASKKAQATEPLPQSMNGSNGARRTANSLMIQREAIYVSGLKRAVTTWGLWYKPLVDTSTPSRATLRQASQEARETAVDVTDAPD